MDFGKNLKQRRKELNLTQEELANQLGIVKSTVSLYESNKRSPDVATLQKIAVILETTGDRLLDLPQRNKTLNLSLQDQTHLAQYQKLNEEGKIKVDKYTEDMVNLYPNELSNVVRLSKDGNNTFEEFGEIEGFEEIERVKLLARNSGNLSKENEALLEEKISAVHKKYAESLKNNQ